MTVASLPRLLHRAADRIDRSCGPLLQRTAVTRSAWVAVLDAIVASQSDRRYLRRAILPALARAGLPRLLFVGVRGYTRSYAEAIQRAGTEYWTCDIDPAAAPHGASGRHRTADARQLDAAFPPGFFDAVIMNGVFGWGVDTPDGMGHALAATHRVLTARGFLLLGWNSDRTPDPDTIPQIGLFTAAGFAGLPTRKSFPDVTHVYGWYQARAAEAAEGSDLAADR